MQKNKYSEFTEISIAIYGDECELSSYKRGGLNLSFIFDGSVNGYITVDNLVTTVRDGVGRFDARLLSGGDYEPRLICDGRMIALPSIRKTDRCVFPIPPSDGYIRAVSIRERELERKVEDLTMLVSRLQDSVFGKTIF